MAVVSRATFATTLAALIADNTAGDISAADVRSILTDLEDSAVWNGEAATAVHTHLAAGAYQEAV